jgi:glycine cleavage system H protein
MEGFSRIDIFDTKGIEYIFVIGYLVFLIVFWKVASRPLKPVKQFLAAAGVLSARMLKIPQGIFYSRNHTWTHLDPSGTAKVGLDDLLQHITGEVQFKHFKSPGEMISKGDLLTEIGRDGKQLRIFSPISGEILDTNETLAGNPEIVNEDPYWKGWICEIKPSNWKDETRTCYLAEEATHWSWNELERFKDFLAGTAKKHSLEPSLAILQDGGELRDNTLSDLSVDIWEDFQSDFLSYTS